MRAPVVGLLRDER